ncbi:hypothetical protein [Halosimplex sp. TS25]|uniref:hypothetical protein n=1 Tax=Halosimplex rarum TaxID=3396619 RepID=UPI0039E81770
MVRGRTVVGAGAFIALLAAVAVLVVLVGLPVDGDGPGDQRRNVGSGDGASAPPLTEQSLRIRNVAVEERPDGYEMTVELFNLVREREQGDPAALKNASVAGFNVSGERTCRARLPRPVEPNASVTVELSCERVPMVLETRFGEERCRYGGGRFGFEVRSHVWGYLGANASGHHWTAIGDTGCGGYFPHNRIAGHVGCKQRMAALNVSAVPDPKPWLDPGLSVPRERVGYRIATLDGNGTAARPEGDAGAAHPLLAQAVESDAPVEVNRSTWYETVSALENDTVALSSELPGADAPHVTVRDKHTTNCWQSISHPDYDAELVGEETAHDGFRATTLRYRAVVDGTVHRVALTRNVSYATGSKPHQHVHVDARSISESAITSVKFQGSPSLWSRVTVDAVDRGSDGIRYSNVSAVPEALRETFVHADRNGTHRQVIHERAYLNAIQHALDDKNISRVGGDYFPCGVGYVDCKTNEHSLILKQEAYFVVRYQGEYYYVELVVDPHARDDDGTEWTG